MKFKTALVTVLREIQVELREMRGEISGIKVALAEREHDMNHRVSMLESDNARHERRISAAESRLSKAGAE